MLLPSRFGNSESLNFFGIFLGFCVFVPRNMCFHAEDAESKRRLLEAMNAQCHVTITDYTTKTSTKKPKKWTVLPNRTSKGRRSNRLGAAKKCGRRRDAGDD